MKVAVGALLVLGLVAGCSSGSTRDASSTPAIAPMTHYPPTTIAEARSFAAIGDSTVFHLVKLVNYPFGKCERPNYIVTVSPHVAGKVLAADELAFMVAHGGSTDSGLTRAEHLHCLAVPSGCSDGTARDS